MMLASMPGGTVIAGEYSVEITGTEGTAFGGTCLLITANNNKNYAASGSVPLTLAFSGDIISCGLQMKTPAGHLRIVIKNADGRVVAESSAVHPFGVVIAAGR